MLPAILTVGSPSEDVTPIGRMRLRLPRFPSTHPKTVIAATVVAAVGAALLAPQWRFDTNPLRVRDPGAHTVQLFEELLASGDLNPWTAEIVAPDVDHADQLAERFRRLESVESVRTLSSFVPGDQQPKREILDETAFLLHLAPASHTAGGASADQVVSSARALERALRAVDEDPTLGAAAGELARALAALLTTDDPSAVVAQLDAQLMAPMRTGVSRLGRALSPGELTQESLPPALRARMQSDAGPARVQIFPAGDLMHAGFTAGFVSDLQAVSGDVTGTSIYMIESGALIVRALQQAFGWAFAGVLLLLLLLWRRPDDALLVLVPLVLAALLTAGTSVALGLPLNFANVIVLPLLLGIGVDSGIHLVHRHRHLGDREGSGGAAGARGLLDSPTSRAVVWSALTTIASFGTLGFTTHRGMASLGQLLALGVSLTVVANLVALPALLAVLRERPHSSAS